MKQFTLFLLTVFIFSNFLFSQEPSKISVAVIDLSGKNVPESGIVALSNVVRRELVRIGNFNVVDRGNMETILQEQGFQQTGCTSQECIVQVGKILGVQKMVSGNIGQLGKKFIIDLQITDVQTGKIEKIETEEFIGEIENLDKSVILVTRRLTGVSGEELKEALIYINSEPKGAKVYIDNVFIGNSPMELSYSGLSKFGISEMDKYTVKIEAGGYESWTRIISVKKGELNTIMATLIQKVASSETGGGKPEWNKMHYGLGISAGLISGMGFGFKAVSVREKVGFEISAGYITDVFGSIGGQLTYNLHNGIYSRFYMLTGIGYYRDPDKINDPIKPPGSNMFAMGLGLGLEFSQVKLISKQVTTLIELTLIRIAEEGSNPKIIALPQIGVYYYFK
jgi:TolB-like protein